MDLNLVVLAGRLAAPVEVRQFESGSRFVRVLVTVRQETPRRVDVVPVTQWDPPEVALDALADAPPGVNLWVAGSVQRRFWEGSEGRRSRLEVVADQIVVRGDGVDIDTERR